MKFDNCDEKDINKVKDLIRSETQGYCGFCRMPTFWFCMETGQYACSETHLDYLREQFKYREG